MFLIFKDLKNLCTTMNPVDKPMTIPTQRRRHKRLGLIHQLKIVPNRWSTRQTKVK